jgi:hypothetical protein
MFLFFNTYAYDDRGMLIFLDESGNLDFGPKGTIFFVLTAVVVNEPAVSGRPHLLCFHRTMSDFNAQIADYCSWARYVSLERGEGRPMGSLSKLNIAEYQIKK